MDGTFLQQQPARWAFVHRSRGSSLIPAAASWLRSASLRTSAATTAKTLPCSAVWRPRWPRSGPAGCGLVGDVVDDADLVWQYWSWPAPWLTADPPASVASLAALLAMPSSHLGVLSVCVTDDAACSTVADISSRLPWLARWRPAVAIGPWTTPVPETGGCPDRSASAITCRRRCMAPRLARDALPRHAGRRRPRAEVALARATSRVAPLSGLTMERVMAIATRAASTTVLTALKAGMMRTASSVALAAAVSPSALAPFSIFEGQRVQFAPAASRPRQGRTCCTGGPCISRPRWRRSKRTSSSAVLRDSITFNDVLSALGLVCHGVAGTNFS